jgi:hypothetical protein
MKTITVSALILTFGCLTAGAILADPSIYKWVDDQGHVHYSTVPHGDKAQQLAIPNTAMPNAGTAVTPAASASTAEQKDTALMQPKASDSADCREARERLFKFLHSDNLYQLDANGNKLPLPPADKQKAVDDARDHVKQVCGGGT